MEWIVVQTKSGQEASAAVNLGAFGVEHFAPIALKNGKESALFPGYLFAKMDRDYGDWSVFQRTRGVVGLVRFGETILSMPETAIAAIKRRQVAGVTQIESEFSKGDRVLLIDGVFKFLTGEVISTCGDAVKVLIQFGNTDQVFDFEYQILEKID